MLRTELTHPDILAVVARAGHHATILIADGNYPASSKKGPNAAVISMNLSPGVVTCNQTLAALLSVVPVEAAHVMQTEADGPYALDGDPEVWTDYRQTIADSGHDLQLSEVDKWGFYEKVETPDHVLTIQTADQQRYANILLTVGVRM